MRLKHRKVVNLALQGGGAHGAFTWGVLDRLLEEEQLVIEGLSGTSSGAMNATALACGLVADGREGARQMLADFWNRVGTDVPISTSFNPGPSRKLVLEGMQALTQVFSPYQLNPLNLNPLREIVTDLFGFERLRVQSRLKLYITATQVRTGKLRLFKAHELSADVLLASACLPSIHQAVEIDGEAYWDGGYTGNPALFPLFYGCDSLDMVVILLHPLSRPDLPKSASEIRQRISELSFGTTFLREMRTIVQAKQQIDRQWLTLGRLDRRLRHLRVHLIEPDSQLTEQDASSKLDNRSSFLVSLRDRGRMQAEAWLDAHSDRLGRRSSVDLAERFC